MIMKEKKYYEDLIAAIKKNQFIVGENKKIANKIMKIDNKKNILEFKKHN